MNRKDVEIMAPVGSYESLQAAIQAGADAVYFGVEKLNMRSRSSYNFTMDDLKRICDICGPLRIRTYLTLNTVIYNEELSLAREIIRLAKISGINAIIVSDQSVIAMAREEDMEVHLSTQLNISNIESLKFYSQYADVVVLARELNLEQIAEISHQIKAQDVRGPSGEFIRLELFVHGAFCMAISGKCYMSLHQYNYSANRGACLQACRRSYIVKEKETGRELEIDNEYFMSPKDLCTISFIDKILEAGVSVLKIEGRARSPEYVKTVTSSYHEAVNTWLEGSFTQEKVENWNRDLGRVFNRGFWDGYYLGREMGEWSKGYGSMATERKIYIGKGMNYFDKIGVAEFLVESGSVKTGDKILVTGPTTGVAESRIEELRVERKIVKEAKKGDHFSILMETVIRRSDKLYKIVDSEQARKQ